MGFDEVLPSIRKTGGFVADEERLCACDRSGQHLTGELKVLGDMGLRDFQVREDRHDRRSSGLGREDQ